MPNIGAALLAFAALAGQAPGVANDAAARLKPALRVVQGRVLDSRGLPVRKGKVFFGPSDPRIGFTEGSTASLDADGRYRVELKDFTDDSDSVSASGPLRFLALAVDFHPEFGKIEPGIGPSTIDIRLAPEPWKKTHLRFVNCRGEALANVDADLVGSCPG